MTIIKHNHFGISKKDRFFLYLWYNVNTPHMSKLGDHFVEAGKDPVKGCYDRIYNSLLVESYKWDDGEIIIQQLWDVSKYAAKVKRFYKNGKIDNVIRQDDTIRWSIYKSDVHKIEAEQLEDLVTEFVKKQDLQLPICEVPTMVGQAIDDITTLLKSGNKIINCVLPPRFRKTQTGGFIGLEMEWDLLIVASYVGTVFYGYKRQLSAYQQFKNVAIIDCSNKDYQIQILNALQSGKKVIAMLSLNNGSLRDSRFKFLYSICENSRGTIIEEPDLGAWRISQVKAIKKYQSENELVLFMGGTNGERAVAMWDIDDVYEKTYVEILVQKEITKKSLKKQIKSKLKYVKINAELDLEYVELAGFQLDISTAFAKAKELGEIKPNLKLQAWSDFGKNPNKFKGWYSVLLQSIFLGHHGLDNLNIDLLLDSTLKFNYPNRRVHLMWFSPKTGKKNLQKIADITRQTLNGYEVRVLTGDTTKNKKVEADVVDFLKKNPDKNVILISMNMATRSFSIGEIYDVHFCFDGGQVGTTIQKGMRVTTTDSNNLNKVGFIYSYSFDPNRDDKFDSLVFDAADNLTKRNNKSIIENIELVLNAFSLWKSNQTGSIKMVSSDFIDEAMSRESVSRIFGSKAPVHLIPYYIKDALRNGNIDILKNIQRDKLDIKSLSHKKETAFTKNLNKIKRDKIDDDVKKMIITLIEKSHIVIGAGRHIGAKGLLDSFNKFEKHKDFKLIKESISSHFNIDYDIIKLCYQMNWVPVNISELKSNKKFKNDK